MGLTTKKIKGINPGILVCNGPSLADVPLDFLHRYDSLASNSFYKKEGLKPTHWFLEGYNHLKTEEERAERKKYMHIPETVLINSRQIHHFAEFGNTVPVDYLDVRGMKIHGFQKAPGAWGHGTANSVTYAMLQYAFEWGYDPLLIVGMDMRFEGDNWHFYEDSGPFHAMDKERFETWRIRAESSYAECATEFYKAGRSVLNLTPDTACKAFVTDKLENWL